jgi:GntR family transcriptional regulator/MocR family aminotransferase
MREPDGPFAFELDRSDERSLAEQLQQRLRAAIEAGQLQSGARLPSWRDLAAQLGVARGTVRAAYERLVDERLITASGAAGTHVAGTPPPRVRRVRVAAPSDLSLVYSAPPLPFQMGVPAQDAFPAKLWARVFTASARADAFAPATYADPRGEPALREQIAAYLAIARGLRCAPEQVFVTSGFRGGLRLALDVLRVAGRTAWIEEPSFPLTRAGLAAAGLTPVAIDVDDEGLDVAEGIARAPDAAVVVVTPGQQAPLGVALSPRRRQVLLRWAKRADAWVIEDDYLGELQLDGRAAPALAATDPAGRVLHLGTFSKTLSPALGVGFLVAPPALAERAAHVAGCLAPAPARATQLALVTLLRDGHFLRHLRRMKRLYRARRDALLARLGGGKAAGLAVLWDLPPGADDRAIAHAAQARGIAPVPLSPWFTRAARPGLLLGVSTVAEDRLEAACAALLDVTALWSSSQDPPSP